MYYVSTLPDDGDCMSTLPDDGDYMSTLPDDGDYMSTLPDDGDHTEICWSYCTFNVNFNTPLKTILLCISW